MRRLMRDRDVEQFNKQAASYDSSLAGRRFHRPVQQAMARIAALIYAIWLLYSVTQSSKRQGFHDLQADTVVVRRTPATS